MSRSFPLLLNLFKFHLVTLLNIISCCHCETVILKTIYFYTQGLSCPTACGMLLPSPGQGLNVCPPHWQVDSYPPDHQGSPWQAVLKQQLRGLAREAGRAKPSPCVPLCGMSSPLLTSSPQLTVWPWASHFPFPGLSFLIAELDWEFLRGGQLFLSTP